MQAEEISIAPITGCINLEAILQRDKFAFVSGDEYFLSDKLNAARDDLWHEWDYLELDNYLKNNGRFRYRRFANYYFNPSKDELLDFPATTYYQSKDLNSYAGGIHRKIAHLKSSTLSNPFLLELIKFNFQKLPISHEKMKQSWFVDVHQFRIISTPSEVGEPTPEGIHRDENDYIAMHLVKRKNTKGGINTIYDNDKNFLESSLLLNPMDSVIICDNDVMHGVSSITPVDPTQPAIRDILLIGYLYDPSLLPPTFDQ